MKFKEFLNEDRKEITDISKAIKAWFKNKGIKDIRVKTGTSKSPFIHAWFSGFLPTDNRMPVDIRNKSLDIIYGTNFERNKENPNAGNVMGNGIAMSVEQWKKLIA